MMQTRKQSLIEAFANILVGYAVNMVANFFVFPLFGWHIDLHQNLLLGVIYTFISLVRSYSLRRIYNYLHSERH